jgi:hypothetical protein
MHVYMYMCCVALADKACIDQSNIDQSLACLPVFLAGCSVLLVTPGPTYCQRLWCCMEVCYPIVMISIAVLSRYAHCSGRGHCWMRMRRASLHPRLRTRASLHSFSRFCTLAATRIRFKYCRWPRARCHCHTRITFVASTERIAPRLPRLVLAPSFPFSCHILRSVEHFSHRRCTRHCPR